MFQVSVKIFPILLKKKKKAILFYILYSLAIGEIKIESRGGKTSAGN